MQIDNTFHVCDCLGACGLHVSYMYMQHATLMWKINMRVESQLGMGNTEISLCQLLPD